MDINNLELPCYFTRWLITPKLKKKDFNYSLSRVSDIAKVEGKECLSYRLIL